MPLPGAQDSPFPAVFHHRGFCSCRERGLTVALPHTILDATACGGCRGESRTALETSALTSFLLQARRAACCRAARLSLRAGVRHATPLTPLQFADAPAVVEARPRRRRPPRRR